MSEAIGGVRIIGAGLAGCEAAFQAAEAGAHVILHEMRPEKRTPAHKTDCFGELVCSNSLKSEQVQFGAVAVEKRDAEIGFVAAASCGSRRACRAGMR